CRYIAASPRLRAVSRPRSSSTSATATRAPASTISRAVSPPMPRAAPVTSATLPSSWFIVFLPPMLLHRLQERGLLLRRFPAEDRVPVREAAEALDHVDIAHRIAAGALAPGPVRQALEQRQ